MNIKIFDLSGQNGHYRTFRTINDSIHYHGYKLISSK